MAIDRCESAGIVRVKTWLVESTRPVYTGRSTLLGPLGGDLNFRLYPANLTVSIHLNR